GRDLGGLHRPGTRIGARPAPGRGPARGHHRRRRRPVLRPDRDLRHRERAPARRSAAQAPRQEPGRRGPGPAIPEGSSMNITVANLGWWIAGLWAAGTVLGVVQDWISD